MGSSQRDCYSMIGAVDSNYERVWYVLDVRVERSPAVLGAVRRLIQCARRVVRGYTPFKYISESVVLWRDAVDGGRVLHALVRCGGRSLLVTRLDMPLREPPGPGGIPEVLRGALASTDKYVACAGTRGVVLLDQRLVEKPVQTHEYRDGMVGEEYELLCGEVLEVRRSAGSREKCVLEWMPDVTGCCLSPDPEGVLAVLLLDEDTASRVEDMLWRGDETWNLTAKLSLPDVDEYDTIVWLDCRSGDNMCTLSVGIPTMPVGRLPLTTAYLALLPDVIRCIKQVADEAGETVANNPLLRWARS